MTLSRRRFLSISAACALSPQGASAQSWQGHAFGAEVSLTIRANRDTARAAISASRRVIRHVESQFNLYDPTSALSRLNAARILHDPDPLFIDLMRAANAAHMMTGGLFDPTVQPLWAALASGRKTEQAKGALGWERVRFDAAAVRLDTSQALTFNGIAQGFATDLVTDVLSAHGLENALVNIGEYRATGGTWRLGLHDPTHGSLGTRTLHNGAIATSSPGATPLGETGHILHGSATANWSSVSVETPTATMADSLSTAMVLASREEIEVMQTKCAISRITLVDQRGNLTSL